MQKWENIAFDSSLAPAIPMRLYESKVTAKNAPLVLYLRGRAFAQWTENEEPEALIGSVLSKAGAVVLEADYSSVSHNCFPQAMDFAFGALKCLSAKRKQFGGAKSKLFVAGDEAGGNVAAGVALKARDQLPGELSGQILLSPMIDPMMTSASFRGADRIGMRESWSDGWSRYLRNACGPQHPYAAPCLCSRLTGLAPALVATSEDDPLRDEVLGYAERLASAGVVVRKKVFSADCGWTSIYEGGNSGENGKWAASLAAEFADFAGHLSR